MRILLLLTLILVVPGLAQDWSKTRLEVLPGIGIGAVKLGQPIPKESLKYLGEPSRTQEAGEEPAATPAVDASRDPANLIPGL